MKHIIAALLHFPLIKGFLIQKTQIRLEMSTTCGKYDSEDEDGPQYFLQCQRIEYKVVVIFRKTPSSSLDKPG